MSTTELLIVLAAVVAGATVKSITGMGLPIIAIPIIALFVDLQDAVIVMALPSLAANTVLCVGERRHRHETRDLPVLGVTTAAGAAAGTVALVSVPAEPLIVGLILMLVVYIGRHIMFPDAAISPRTATRYAPVAGLTAGLFQGGIGISGPIVASWIHSYRLGPGAHVFSVTLLFAIGGAVQFAILAATGELAGRWLATLAATVPVLAAIPAGRALRGRLSVKGFDTAVIAVLAASALSLTFKLIP